MKLVVKRLFPIAAAVLMSGCALDMRCDDVTKRIAMHEGQPWNLRSSEDPARFVVTMNAAASLAEAAVAAPEMVDLAGHKVASADLTGFTLKVDSKSDASQSSFCPHPKKRTARARKSKSSVIRPGEDESNFTEKTVVAKVINEEVCKALDGNSSPPPGVPANAAAAKALYLLNKQVYLSARKFQVVGGDHSFELKLFNQGLNCVVGSDDAYRWACNPKKDIDLGAAQGSLLEACVGIAQAEALPVKNLIGTIHDRYCLFVSVEEDKPKGHGDIPKATNIQNDRLTAVLQCVNPEGDISPGVVIGGPRPNFRSPDAETM